VETPAKVENYWALFGSSPARKANIFTLLGNSGNLNLMMVTLILNVLFSICSISYVRIAMYLLTAILCSEQLLPKIKKLSSLLSTL